MPQAAILQHITSSGVRIYTLPMEVFPRFIGNAYLVLADGITTLVDAGSGLGNASDDLRRGFETVRSEWGETVTLADLRRIVITHGHIDHFGGLLAVREASAAPLTMHPIDRRILTNYEGRRVIASKSLELFLGRAGVDEAEKARLLQMYAWSKGVFRAMPVEETVEDGDWIDGLMEVIHTPGHCPGQICLRIDDVLLTADHILARTSPHLAPETITPGTGLEHYLSALRRVGALAGIRVGLGGHEEPITDLAGRIAGLRASHERKLERILALIRENPAVTVAQITGMVYQKLEGYDVLLGLEEIGAHVEYLYLRGYVRVANVDELTDTVEFPLCYEVF